MPLRQQHLVSNNLITAITPSSVQQQYFNCTGCPQADPMQIRWQSIDNMIPVPSGLNPTNPASVFGSPRVTQGGTKTITWSTAGVRTNVVQARWATQRWYSNNFSDISGPIVIGSPAIPRETTRIRVEPTITTGSGWDPDGRIEPGIRSGKRGRDGVAEQPKERNVAASTTRNSPAPRSRFPGWRESCRIGF